MNINLFAKGIMLIMVAALTGCISNEDPENETLEVVSISFVHEAIANAPEPNFEKENLPVWLTEYIYNLKPDNVRDVAAFQAKWKGEYVYYVYDGYSSCIRCDIFKSDGRRDWTKKDFYEFWKSEPDWELIYLSKYSIFYACGIKEDKTRSATDTETLLFSEDDIVSFNITTREIKFKDMEEPLYKRVEPFHKIDFRLGAENLFTVSSFVSLIDSRIFDDIVLCYGNQESITLDGKYYLYDCYPDWLADTEAVKANQEKNKKQWETFIRYLDSKGKLIK